MIDLVKTRTLSFRDMKVKMASKMLFTVVVHNYIYILTSIEYLHILLGFCDGILSLVWHGPVPYSGLVPGVAPKTPQ